MPALYARTPKLLFSCRCAACLSKSLPAARHHTVVSIKVAWRFIGGTSSPLLYSTMFATAAFIDGRAKRKRSEQWDAAIASAYDTLDSVSTSPHLRRCYHSQADREEPSAAEWSYAHQRAGMHIDDDGQSAPRPACPKEPGDGGEDGPDLGVVLQMDSRMPGAERLPWPANTGPALVPHCLPPQSLWSWDSDRKISLSRRHTEKKKLRQELSIAKLVHQLAHPLRSEKAV